MGEEKKSWWYTPAAGVLMGSLATFAFGTFPTAYFADRRAEADRLAAAAQLRAELQATNDREINSERVTAIARYSSSCQHSLTLSWRMLALYDDFLSGGKAFDQVSQDERDEIRKVMFDSDVAETAWRSDGAILNAYFSGTVKIPNSLAMLDLILPTSAAEREALYKRNETERKRLDARRAECAAVIDSLTKQVRNAPAK